MACAEVAGGALTGASVGGAAVLGTAVVDAAVGVVTAVVAGTTDVVEATTVGGRDGPLTDELPQATAASTTAASRTNDLLIRFMSPPSSTGATLALGISASVEVVQRHASRSLIGPGRSP